MNAMMTPGYLQLAHLHVCLAADFFISKLMCPSKRKPTLQVKSYYWDN